MGSWIEDYAMIGDGRTAALVSRGGSIDWLCLPRFDSDACCAALLGDERHGYWRIAPCDSASVRRSYRGDTLVLDTEFTGPSGKARLTDFMAASAPQPTVIRYLTGLDGLLRFRCEMVLQFDYGLIQPHIRQQDGVYMAIAGPHLAAVHAPVQWDLCGGGMVAEFDVAAGQTAAFVMSHGPSHFDPPAKIDAAQALDATLAIWQRWASEFRRKTVWREPVMRSLLTLKGLTYWPTGGIVAAATTSLPERPYGGLNWDYRYSWLRDASFTIAALLNAGYHEEAIAWRDWMLRAIAGSPDKLHIAYRLDGSRQMQERTAEWLPGYRGAKPVRIGNDAAGQRQIDVAGELLDAMDLMACGGVPDTPETLALEQDLVGHLESVWDHKGNGFWESRGDPHRYTYAVVMAWVGLDRFLRRSARYTGTNDATLDRLRALRKHIRAEIEDRAWHRAHGHFVHRYGGERVDPTLLLLPLVNFLPADEPRMSATIDAVVRELSEDGLVWRTSRGGETDEGAFIACSCWLADCRILQGRRGEAQALLERVLALRNDVGLLSEMYHPGLGRLIGNFPQALSHLAIINTALGLSGPVLQPGGG